MPLEAGDGFISGLNASNPVGSTDKVQTLDDHVRLIKTAVKGSFPNVNAAVNFTPAQANILVTDGAGAGMLADIAAIADPGADRVLGWDESANAAIAFTLSTGLTTSTTNLLIDTTVVPQLGQANRFSAAASASTPPIRVGTAADNFTTGATTLFGIAAAGTASFAIRDETNNTEGAIQITATEFSIGSVTSTPLNFLVGGSGKLTLGTDGGVTTAGAVATEVGYQGLPLTTKNENYTLTLADRNKALICTSTGGFTWTIPANASVAYPVGTVLGFINYSAACTIAITSDTMNLAGAGTTGSRTLAQYGEAYAKKVSSTIWLISGVGLT